MFRTFDLEKAFIYIGITLFSTLFLVSFFGIFAYYAEKMISKNTKIDEMLISYKAVEKQIESQRRVLEESGFTDQDIIRIEGLDKNLSKSLFEVKELAVELAEFKSSFVELRDNFIASNEAVLASHSDFEKKNKAMESTFKSLKEGVDKITSLESSNMELLALVARQRELLILVDESIRNGKNSELNEEIKKRIADAAEGNLNIQVGGPEAE